MHTCVLRLSTHTYSNTNCHSVRLYYLSFGSSRFSLSCLLFLCHIPHMSMHTNTTPHTHTHSLSFGEDNVFGAMVCVMNYLMNEDDAKAKISQEA